MSRKIEIITVAALSLLLAGCTDVPTILAGGAKGYCKGTGNTPCTRPAPGNAPNTPPR